MNQAAFNFETLARRSDPPSSKAAARKVVESGTVASHEEIILNLLSQYPGRTSKQLATLGPLDRVAIARRLKKMEEKKLIRRTQEGKGRVQMVGSMSTEIEKKYTDKEFCEMYGIDRRTSKRWRDQRYINFMKTPSGKIRYLQRHIDEFDKRGEKSARKRAA